MNEDALRALIRETIARVQADSVGLHPADLAPRASNLADFPSHASHFRYALPKAGSACVIEPGVSCNHCGYCESHGH